ncbi:autotransporter domain-containing protein [Mesorhizobium sp. CAU 1732]|uniref:autotransporter domain-containing protein n=1 Tax=Mesorhizobium sp. CAU 1732 TaxID=3140358 RepID=UPI003261B598
MRASGIIRSFGGTGRTGQALPLIVITTMPLPAFGQAFTGTETTSGPFSSGFQQFYDSSTLDASAGDAVSGGTQYFFDTSELNASATNAITGGTQTFRDSSMLNASTAYALSDGSQQFYDNSVLNASAANAISGGNQTFNNANMLKVSAANAISGGVQSFWNTSTLNASAANAVSGGIQSFAGLSVLNASAADAVSGGTQFFYADSRLDASAIGAVSGGAQDFYGSSVFDASANDAISGGYQTFHDNSILNASVSGAVSGGTQRFYQDSSLNLLADDALTTTTDFRFDNISGGTGGTLRLNGYSTTIGAIVSETPGSGLITNGGSTDSTLTVDTSHIGPTKFSGMINDGGTGSLGLSLAGGALTLAGTASHTGGTTVSNGTLTVTGLLGGDFTVHDGALIIDGGTLERPSALSQSTIGQNAGDDATLVVTNAGTLSTANKVHVGDAAGSRGEVRVTGSGSSLEVADITVGFGGEGILSVLGGGHLSSATFMNVGGGNYGQLGSGVLLVDGAGSTADIAGPLVVAGFGDGSTGAVTVSNGGTVNAGAVWLGVGNTSGSASLNIGAASVDATDAVATGTLTASHIQFYTDAASLNFNHTDSAYTFDTKLSGSAGFLNHYAGNTIFIGDSSSFSGDTTVHGGTVLVDGTLGGTMTVNAGATLGGSGTIGTTTVADGGSLAPGNSIGTLNISGDLILSAGSLLNYELGSPGATSSSPGMSDSISVAGDLTLNGTLNLAQSDDAADGVAGFGYYRLMIYGGDLSGSGLTVGTTPGLAAPAAYEIQAGGGNIDLFVASPGDDTLQHWQGGDGTWNATNTQWLNGGSAVPVSWAGNHAVFRNEPGGFGGGTVTVAGAQSFKGLQFVDGGYRLEGPGSLVVNGSGNIDGNAEIRVLAGETAEIATTITGADGLTKTQGGMLVLEGNNTYHGGTQLLGGAVSVSSDASLGAASGELAFNGGTLRVTGAGYTSTARAITMEEGGGGFDIADAGNTFTLSQDIIGPGNLVKRGDGSLSLSGRNAYGNSFVEAGTLIGEAASISGDIANAATIVFDQDSDASFDGDIVGLNGTDGVMVKQGVGTLTLDGVSTLDWTIADGGLATEATRFGGDVELGGAGTSFAFVDSGTAAYHGEISGNGQFSLDGEGTVLLTGDSSGFAGSTAIKAGTLLVGDAAGNGTLGGSLDVLAGGTLGGSGTVGSGTRSLVTVASGGTLSPGNSIGTLTVDGNLVFEAGSHLVVEVNPEGSESDLVTVTGNATLNGGAVAHIGANGNYDIRSTHTIVSADGTLSGAFEDVTSNFAFLTPQLVYDYGAGTVDLELSRNERDFASAAQTRNQIAAAEGIESIGLAAGHAVYDAIAQFADDDDLIRASFDAVSGEIHASINTALIEDSRVIRNAANDRIRAAFATAGASYAPVLAYGPGDTPMLVAADHAGPVFWSHGFGSWGSTDSDGNAASLDRLTGGLLIGTDGLVGNWRVGILTGYSHSSFKADDRASSGSSDNYHLGIYGGTEWGNVAFRTGAAYTWHDIETHRSVSIPGLTDSLTAGYNAGTFQAFGELGYGFEARDTRFEPFANLSHVSLRTDGFTETGGAAALSSVNQTTSTTFTTLGLRAEHAITLGTVGATVKGMVGWRHALGDITPNSTHALSAGDAFSIAGVPIARNSAVIETGLDLNLTPDATLGLSYTGQLAGGASDHGFKATLAVNF